MRENLDLKLWPRNKYICGIDEAGRGPIAGPVVAACVVLPPYFFHPAIDDSKKLSPGKRQSLFDLIIRNALAYSFGYANHRTIDRINIYQATIRAMQKAISNLSLKPDLVITDAVFIPDLPFPQKNIIKGDEKSISIAAASILAKVRRDEIMMRFHKAYPQYNFDQHKGYPTKKHRLALARYGPCLIHRKTFKLI